MKIDVAKDDLWRIRMVVSKAITDMENSLNPQAYSEAPVICRKFVRKLNRAIKKAYGHDMYGHTYNT